MWSLNNFLSLIFLVRVDMWSKLVRKQRVVDVVNEAAFEHANGNGLKKVLGVRDLVAFGISSTLGSGIFVTVGSIAAIAGPGLFFSFIIAALGSLLSAVCYAEFASRLPVSGQSYTYSYVALGELAAFLTGWLGFISYSVATAAVSRGWATYLNAFIVAAMGVELPDWLIGSGSSSFSLLAMLLNSACTSLACFGVHESTKLAFILVLVNIALMTGFCIYGTSMYGSVGNLDPLLPFGFTGAVKGSGLAFFCCIGWELVCTLSEEVKRPSRDLPRGIVGSLSIVTVVYCAVCLTLSLMVPYELITPIAPIANAFAIHGDRIGVLVVSLTVVVACIPSTLSGIVGTPRIVYKMAKDGLMYSWLTRVNVHGAPVCAVIVCGALSALMAGFIDFDSLASSCSAVTLFMFVLVNVGVVILRKGEEHGTCVRKLTGSLLVFCLVSLGVSLVLIDPSLVPAHMIQVGIGVNVLCGLLCIVVYFSDSGEKARHAMKDSLLEDKRRIVASPFKCPLVPFIPLVAAWIDIFMMASVGYWALSGLGLLIISGLAVYFSYGITHSKLNIR